MKKYITKENITIYLIILFSTFIIYPHFFKPHYMIDTYRIASLGFSDYGIFAFLPIGRPISCVLYFIFNALKIKLSDATVISFIIGCLLSSLSTTILYKNSINYFKKNYVIKYIILLLSFISLNNFFFLQLYLYCESCIMWFGVLSSIIAAITYTSNTNKRILKTFILLLISIFSYQLTLPIFISYSLLLMIFKNYSIKKFIKEAFIACTLYLFAALCNLIFIYLIVNKLLNIMIYKVSTHPKSLNDYIYIFKNYFDIFFKHSLYYPDYKANSPYVKIYFTILTILVIAVNYKKENWKNIINYIIATVISIIFTLLPMLSMDMSELYMSSKMYIGILIFIPISFIYIVSKYNQKYINAILSILLSILFVYNIKNCLFVNNEYKKLNEEEKKDAIILVNKIKEYETSTNNKVEKIIYYCDIYPKYESNECNITKESYFNQNQSSLYQKSYFNDVINYFGNIKIDNITVGNYNDYIYDNYFKYMNYDNFNDNNVIFIDDTMYINFY